MKLRPDLSLFPGKRARSGGGGGGGDVPAWVESLRAPSGDLPVIAADFKNGRYWGNGAETTADALFEHNPTWGSYSPDAIQAGLGLAPTVAGGGDDAWLQIVPSFYGSLLTTGATFVTTAHCPNITGNSYFDMEADLWDDPGFNSQYGAFIQNFFAAWAGGGGAPGSQFVQIYNAVDGTTDGPLASAAQDIKVAYSALATPMSYSLGGDPIATIASGVPASPWTNIGLTVHNQTTPGEGYMTTIAIYVPQPDADLPALAAL